MRSRRLLPVFRIRCSGILVSNYLKATRVPTHTASGQLVSHGLTAKPGDRPAITLKIRIDRVRIPQVESPLSREFDQSSERESALLSACRFFGKMRGRYIHISKRSSTVDRFTEKLVVSFSRLPTSFGCVLPVGLAKLLAVIDTCGRSCNFCRRAS
jgi:hypothetical protein